MSTNGGPGEGADRTTWTEDSEDHLAFRVFQKSFRYHTWFLALIVGLLGLFGWQVSESLTSLRSTVEDDLHALRLQVDAAGTDLTRLDSVRRELEGLVDRQRTDLQEQRTFLNEQRGFLMDQARRIGGLEVAAGSASARASSSADAADQAQARLDDVRGALLQAGDSLRHMTDSVGRMWGGVQNRVESIEQEVFGSWAFVVKERQTIRLGTLPLTVSMELIDDDILEDLEVRAGGTVLQAAQDVPLRSTLRVCVPADSDARRYRVFELTPTYIVELFLGDDIAGLQVQERGLADQPAACGSPVG